MGERLVTVTWDHFINDYFNDGTDVYFTEAYVKLYETATDLAECYIYRSGNQLFLFPYLKRTNNYKDEQFYDFETPYGYGGPIANTNDADFIAEARENFMAYCREAQVIAGFIRFHPLLNNHLYFENSGNILRDRKTIAIDLLATEQEIWNDQLHSKNRNMIRKAEKLDLAFEIDHEFNNLDAFMSLYKGTMEKVAADDFFLFTSDYFKQLKAGIKNSFIFFVKHEGVYIAASIFMYSKKYGHYHLSCSNEKYLNLGPNNIMIYQAALYLKKAGVEQLHLGGGTDSSEENSLFLFKRRFSQTCHYFYIGKMIFNQDYYEKVSRDWEKSNPAKNEKFNKHLLKYRL